MANPLRRAGSMPDLSDHAGVRPSTGWAALEAGAGIALLSAMDALIKGVAQRLPTFEVAFLRFVAGSLVIAAILAWARPALPTRETILVNAVRALLVVATACTFFYALGTLPLARTLALSFLSPLFIVVFGALLLRERIDAKVVLALAAGFAGMLVIVSGEGGEGAGADVLWGTAAALASALTYALSMVLLRARAGKDAVVVIVALQNVVPALLLAAPAAWVWVTPHPSEWLALAGIGALGVSGHLLLARAFGRAQAARLAPLEYTALIWAVLFGFVAFDEIPTVATLGGALLIVAGALIASRR